MGDEVDDWKPSNWKKLSPQEIKALPRVLKSKYLAYEEPPSELVKKQEDAAKRSKAIRETYKQRNTRTSKDPHAQEKEKQDILIGQLKAAEARNRLKLMKSKYYHYRSEDVHHLITSQPTGLSAVKLECLLPPSSAPGNPSTQGVPKLLNKLQKHRVELLLDDPSSYA